MLKLLLWSLAGLVAFFVVIQAVPYGRQHTNPPARVEPTWDSPQTRALAARACYDCHSNETMWPWYSNVAPISWLVQSDVDRGRMELNFSAWDNPPKEPGESAEKVLESEMPMWYYTAAQPKAALPVEETQALIRGLEATLGTESRTGEREAGNRERRR
ncbi:MAG: heme-binding domain-containing protein [Chloroflexota bacterium]